MDHLMKTMSAGLADKSLTFKFAPAAGGLKTEGKYLGGGHHGPGTVGHSYNAENLLNLVSHTVSKI